MHGRKSLSERKSLLDVELATSFFFHFSCFVAGTITCLAFHNNTHMLSASEDRTICVWECRTWECLKTLKGHR